MMMREGVLLTPIANDDERTGAFDPLMMMREGVLLTPIANDDERRGAFDPHS